MMRAVMRAPLAIVAAVPLVAIACSSPAPAPSGDVGVPLGEPVPYVDAGERATDKERVDGGFAAPDGGVVRADRFVTEVVTFQPGPCAGFGAAGMPEVVTGPPIGSGAFAGGLDVVSLGVGGEIVVNFGANAVVDGPGVDFVVFENAFYAGGNPSQPATDLAEVSVSEDGVTWIAFPCEAGGPAPHGTCAGWRPVESAPGGVSPFDVAQAGGDPYDLSTLGLTRARFVRIKDLGQKTCPTEPPLPTNLGFDLDAIAVIHAEID